MRDYSFGNFISALRIRRGLSQYQLGALVGVSDKAVSKWETGVSKPRMDTIIKLAEVLDVRTDELLACKYVAFNHERKDLFAMDRKIIRKAELKMKEMYGECPPIAIMNRFKTEKLMLKNQMMLRWMGFLGELHERFYEKDAFFMVRGAQIGASFIGWLLGGTNVNPLLAHYYCSKCKKIEFIPTVKCGLDAPDKVCSCGNLYKKDGFGIDAIHMYPLAGGSDIEISSNTMEAVKKCFKEYFNDYSEIREIKYKASEIENHSNIVRYILVPTEIAIQYPKEVITLTPEEYYFKFLKMDGLTIIETPAEHISFKDIEDTTISGDDVRDYAKYAAEKGIFKNNLCKMDLNKIVLSFSNLNFSNLLAIEGLLHGTGVWEDNGENLYAQGIPLNELITNREDVYTYLYNKLNGKCCDNPSGQVYESMENIRKGLYSSQGMPSEIEKCLTESGVPDWYIESAKKIRYLFPKAHQINFLKREICIYIRKKKKVIF